VGNLGDECALHHLSAYQAKLYAHELDRSYAADHVGRLAGLLFDAQVEPKPHQVDAALLALQTLFTKGVILADEVGLARRSRPVLSPASTGHSIIGASSELKHEARQWRHKIDDAEDEYRTERKRLRGESEEYLDNARDALNTTDNRRELFTITWEVH